MILKGCNKQCFHITEQQFKFICTQIIIQTWVQFHFYAAEVEKRTKTIIIITQKNRDQYYFDPPYSRLFYEGIISQ